MIKSNITSALIFEDDAKLAANFKEQALTVLKEAERLGSWDLVYFSRKWISGEETFVENSELLVNNGYSYWTVAYALSLEGAKKLVDAKPLESLVPVDEFLPIMYGKQPNAEWNRHFPTAGTLKASAVVHNLAEPLYYTEDKGYISDTEQTDVVQINIL